MSILFRLLLIGTVIFATYWMFRMINRSRMKISDSIFWIFLAFILIVLGIYPSIMRSFSDVLGIYSEANLLFAVILFIMLVKVFLMSVENSRLTNRIDNLTQQIALKNRDDKIYLESLEKKVENLQNELEKGAGKSNIKNSEILVSESCSEEEINI
ncbi:DUF2304 family protein [Ileibacterium valens]|uniref:DUF2304 family protein n=1 Tax=Ileibacterium valens TaxID=1862668 RepID=UPI00272CF206|nr:DUF2304 family protein [Ileibacterium valens]